MQFIYTFISLFIFWIILSGNFDAFHLTLGVISALIVTFWTGDLLLKGIKVSLLGTPKLLIKLLIYSVWLLYEIVLANLHVIYVALHPNMDQLLEPSIVTFKTTLKDDISQFLLANSITLTPGTITIDIKENTFYIHALTKQAASGVPGDMQSKIAKIMGETGSGC